MYLSYSPNKSCFFAASRIPRTYTIITPATWRQDISSAPEWKQQWLQHNQKLSAPCDRLDCLQQKFQSEPGKRKGLGEKLMGSTWLDIPFFPTQPNLEFGYVWILLFVLLNVTSAGKNSPLPSAPKSGGAVLMAVQDGTGTRVWFLTVQMWGWLKI